MLAAVISLPESKEGRGDGHGGIQLSSLMTDACRSVHGGQRLRDHDPLWREILPSVSSGRNDLLGTTSSRLRRV